MPSVLFNDLSDDEITVYFHLLNGGDIDKLSDSEKERINSLVEKEYLIRTEDNITLPDKGLIVKKFLQNELNYRSDQLNSEGEISYLAEIKNYLVNVQKQIAHVETESRKSFLNIRKMVDKITDHGKNYLNIAFKRALDRNSETNEWVSIPHISPVGLYEPMQDLKDKFEVIIDELENSLEHMVDEYIIYTEDLLEDYVQKIQNNEIEPKTDKILDQMYQKKKQIIKDTSKFSNEVLEALNEQVNLLEKNLSKDLIKQMDAIERLNDLKPERVWIMLEETRSELMVHLNNVYSRILQEINTLQLQVDVSKVSLILTNEAGKAIKKVEKLNEEPYNHKLTLAEIYQMIKDD